MLLDNLEKYRYSDNQNLSEDERMKIDPTKNTVICGDNIEWLSWIPDESIDLCYIDPPFFSNSTYEKVWGNGWEVASFEDRFSGGIQHYIDWMEPRIELIHKKLKKTGSIFLHCDYHASHRLRCLLDEKFKEYNFVNEIVWHYRRWTNSSSKLQNMHDLIFWFSKSNNYTFNSIENEPSDSQKKKFEKGWDQNVINNKDGKYTQYIVYNMEKFKEMANPNKNAKIIDKTTKNLQVAGSDVFIMPILNSQAKERIGYKTQKPESLIKKIIECSSKEGDVVLDCFSGGFTTAKVCADLNRKFICGDVSPVACKIGMKRLNNHNFFEYESKGLPQTEEEFREMNGHEFAESICELMGWKCNPKKSNDKGIDGWDGNENPIQIKNQKSKTGEKDIRNFLGSLHTAKKKIGIFVAWDFTPDAIEFVAKQKKDFDIQLRKCRDLIGDLLISNEKRAEIEAFYQGQLPKEWKENLLQKSA